MNGEEKLPVNNAFHPVLRFAIRIHSKSADKTIWVQPAANPLIGEFEFAEGMDGFVDVLSEGSEGQVLVDSLVFKTLP